MRQPERDLQEILNERDLEVNNMRILASVNDALRRLGYAEDSLDKFNDQGETGNLDNAMSEIKRASDSLREVLEKYGTEG